MLLPLAAAPLLLPLAPGLELAGRRSCSPPLASPAGAAGHPCPIRRPELRAPARLAGRNWSSPCPGRLAAGAVAPPTRSPVGAADSGASWRSAWRRQGQATQGKGNVAADPFLAAAAERSGSRGEWRGSVARRRAVCRGRGPAPAPPSRGARATIRPPAPGLHLRHAPPGLRGPPHPLPRLLLLHYSGALESDAPKSPDPLLLPLPTSAIPIRRSHTRAGGIGQRA